MLQQSNVETEIFVAVAIGVALILLLILYIFFNSNKKYILKKDADEKISKIKTELERNVLEKAEALYKSEKRFQG